MPGTPMETLCSALNFLPALCPLWATYCEELAHWNRPYCWERLKAGGEGGHRGWDSWMASLTQWTWVWVGSGSWCQTGRPGMLQLMGSQRVGHAWATELNWTMPSFLKLDSCSPQIREYKTLLTFPITRKACKLSFNILLRIAQIPIPR